MAAYERILREPFRVLDLNGSRLRERCANDRERVDLVLMDNRNGYVRAMGTVPVADVMQRSPQ